MVLGKKNMFLLSVLTISFISSCGKSDNPSIVNISKKNSTLDVSDKYCTDLTEEKLNPLGKYQWHLLNQGNTAFASTLPKAGEDINVASVLKEDCLSGNQVYVGVVDSGLELAHPSLSPNIENNPTVSKTWSINFRNNNLKPNENFSDEVKQIISALEIFAYSFDECVKDLNSFVVKANKENEFETILSKIRLYNIEQPFVALASDYGVPQNRERVLFIGCRKDQKLINDIPETVKQNEKVNVFEAIYDLDFIGNDDERFDYEKINLKAQYNGSTEKMKALIKKRNIEGTPNENNGLSYSEW